MYADDDDRRRNNASKHAFKTENPHNLRTKFDNSGPNLKDPTKI